MDEQVGITGIHFLGTTLWAEFEMFGKPEASMRIGGQATDDFQYIHPFENGRWLAAGDP